MDKIQLLKSKIERSTAIGFAIGILKGILSSVKLADNQKKSIIEAINNLEKICLLKN